MKYTCTSCGYTYDEAIGDMVEGILPGTRVEDLGENFICPGCYEPIETFHGYNEEIIYPNDTNNLSPLEKEHHIHYTIEGDKLYVSVGLEGSTHASTPEHFISSIMLYDESQEMIEERFLDSESDAEVVFDLDYIDRFEIRIRCNIHGVWGSGMIGV